MRKNTTLRAAPAARLSPSGRHILLTGDRSHSPAGSARAYSGFIPTSDRLQASAFLSGISPLTAPGLAVGDYLVDCSEYTGEAEDPYTGAGSAPVALLANTTMAPLFFQRYAALTAAVQAVTATMPGGATVTLHTPENVSGADGGRARIDIAPESTAGWGTYIFRLIRIINVPANPAVAYTADIYELGVTVNDTQLLAWGQQL